VMLRSIARLDRGFHEIPGPKQWPLVGSLPDFMGQGPGIHRVHKAYYLKYGPIVRINLLGNQEVIVYDPNEYLKVFRQESNFPTGFVGDLWMVHEIFKTRPYKSFVQSQGIEWQQKRREVQKYVMSPAVAASYLDAINDTAKKVSSRIDVLALSSKSNQVELKQLTKYISFDLFCSAALGKSLNTIDPANADPRDLQMVEDSSGSLNRTVKLMEKPYAKYIPTREYKECESMYQGVDRRGHELVQQAVQDLENGLAVSDETGPIVHRMLAGGVDPVAVNGELAALLGASVDTTQHVILWLLLNLATHPAAQQKLSSELDSVLGGADYTKEVQAKLPYMKAVIRESHRRNHTNPLLTMRRLDSDISLCGYNIPAGTRITFNGADIQQDPKVVENAERFFPDRFLPEQVALRQHDKTLSTLDHKLLATPFGFGARMCVGARLAESEVWALICRLLQDFELRLDPPNQTWDIAMPFMTIADPYPSISFIRRAQTPSKA